MLDKLPENYNLPKSLLYVSKVSLLLKEFFRFLVDKCLPYIMLMTSTIILIYAIEMKTIDTPFIFVFDYIVILYCLLIQCHNNCNQSVQR